MESLSFILIYSIITVFLVGAVSSIFAITNYFDSKHNADTLSDDLCHWECMFGGCFIFSTKPEKYLDTAGNLTQEGRDRMAGEANTLLGKHKFKSEDVMVGCLEHGQSFRDLKKGKLSPETVWLNTKESLDHSLKVVYISTM